MVEGNQTIILDPLHLEFCVVVSRTGLIAGRAHLSQERASLALPPQAKRCAKLCAHQATVDFRGVRTAAQQVTRSPVDNQASSLCSSSNFLEINMIKSE